VSIVHTSKSGVFTVAAALLLAALLPLGGCATKADLAQSQLTDLALVLPGLYGNPKQVLLILNVFSPLLKGNVMYVRESDAADSRRVYSERIWNLDVSGSGHIVATLYAFDQPERWHDGAENPELFRSLMEQDLRPLPGCELIWEKTARGYSATSASPRCPQSWKLEGDALAFSERPVDSSPGAPDGYFHFVRQSTSQ
jgi:hypothetical protein